MESIEPWLVGIFRAPISCLSFSPNVSASRLANPSNTEKKVRLFKKTELCRPHVTENQILVQIDSATRKKILSLVDTPSEELKDPYTPHELPHGFHFHCQDGRHRVEAARRLWGPNYEWVLRLYCADVQAGSVARFQYLFKRRCEAVSFQVPYSDGEIYAKLRTESLDFSDRNDWTKRLSNSKEPILRMLLRHGQLTECLDRLLKFPGLWAGLQLGNIHKHIALHCDEELVHYLTVTYNVWQNITDRNDNVALAVDVETVQNLQNRCPRGQDAVEIRSLFQDKKLFPTITDASLRGILQERILSQEGFIPSLETFHKDTMYFSIAVKAIKRWVASDIDPRDPSKATLRTVLKADFQHGVEPVPIQVREHGWENLSDNSFTTDQRFHISYTQLVLAALRRFADLTNESPIQEVRGQRLQGVIDGTYVSNFQDTAARLGFITPKIRNRPKVPSIAKMRDLSQFDCLSKNVWRGGKPTISAYLQLQGSLFYPQLAEITRPTVDTPFTSIHTQAFILFEFLEVQEYPVIVQPAKDIARLVQCGTPLIPIPAPVNPTTVPAGKFTGKFAHLKIPPQIIPQKREAKKTLERVKLDKRPMHKDPRRSHLPFPAENPNTIGDPVLTTETAGRSDHVLDNESRRSHLPFPAENPNTIGDPVLTTETAGRSNHVLDNESRKSHLPAENPNTLGDSMLTTETAGRSDHLFDDESMDEDATEEGGHIAAEDSNAAQTLKPSTNATETQADAKPKINKDPSRRKGRIFKPAQVPPIRGLNSSKKKKILNDLRQRRQPGKAGDPMSIETGSPPRTPLGYSRDLVFSGDVNGGQSPFPLPLIRMEQEE